LLRGYSKYRDILPGSKFLDRKRWGEAEAEMHFGDVKILHHRNQNAAIESQEFPQRNLFRLPFSLQFGYLRNPGQIETYNKLKTKLPSTDSWIDHIHFAFKNE